MLRIEWVQPSRTVLYQVLPITKSYLLGGLLLLVLLLLGLSFIFLCRSLLNNWSGGFFLLLLFHDGNKEADNILALDHVVFINLKFSEDIINLSLGHLVSPGHESVGEHLGIN